MQFGVVLTISHSPELIASHMDRNIARIPLMFSGYLSVKFNEYDCQNWKQQASVKVQKNKEQLYNNEFLSYRCVTIRDKTIVCDIKVYLLAANKKCSVSPYMSVI
jgi:hypothetical protein